MIIQCPTCTTRFNVPDEKISGPQVKVRCSKCKNIFPAGEGNSTIVAGMNSPAAAPASTPPMPTQVPPPAPAQAPPSTSPFGAPGADPFGGPSSPPAPAAAAPAVADPFAAPAPPAGNDPFAPSPTTSGQPTRVDPFGAPAGQPPKKPTSTSMDALRQMASAPLPSVSPPGAAPVARPSSGPFSLPADGASTPPAPAGGDPFASPAPPPGFNAPVNGGAPGGDPFGGPAASMPPQPASGPGPGAAAAPGADPFAAATPPGGDPFANQAGSAPLGSDPFAAGAPPAGADPFAAPAGGDPFAAPGGGDPFDGATGDGQQEALADELFGGGPPGAGRPGGSPPAIPDDDDGAPGGGPFAAGPPDSGSDPFAEAAAGPADDPFSAAAAPSDPFDGQADPFAESGVAPAEALDDPFADAPGTGVAAETRVHQVSEELREKAKPLPRPKKRRQPLTQRTWFTGGVRSIGRAISITVHVLLAAGFLLVAILWARGASIADVKEGRALAVVLSGKTAVQSTEGDLRAVGVVVTRRPLHADPGLVVVTGEVENQGATPVAGVRVEVQFGEDGRVYQAWAGHKVDALDLALAKTPEALRALGTTVARADLLPGEKAPFAVLATEVEDGKKAMVRVRRADVPTPTEGS